MMECGLAPLRATAEGRPAAAPSTSSVSSLPFAVLADELARGISFISDMRGTAVFKAS